MRRASALGLPRQPTNVRPRGLATGSRRAPPDYGRIRGRRRTCPASGHLRSALPVTPAIPAVRMSPRGGHERRAARIGRREASRDCLEHPRPREVESVEMPKLGIGGVGHHAWRKPVAAAVGWQRRQEVAQPAARTPLPAARAASDRPPRRRVTGSLRRTARRPAGTRDPSGRNRARESGAATPAPSRLVARVQSSIKPNAKAVCVCSPLRIGAVSFGSQSAIRETAALVNGASVSVHRRTSASPGCAVAHSCSSAWSWSSHASPYGPRRRRGQRHSGSAPPRRCSRW